MNNYKSKINLLTITFLMALSVLSNAQKPVLSWDFSEINDRKTIERQSGMADTLEGNFHSVAGIRGEGLKLDGFTACLKHEDTNLQSPSDEITVEAWVAVGNYPWNWCPVITTENNETKGYRLMIGPHGEVSFQTAIGEQWISCTTERLTIPLRNWMHIVGVYRANRDLTVFVNGEKRTQMPIRGNMIYPRGGKCLIGMVAYPEKPSDIHRTWGTLPQYFGLNGIFTLSAHGHGGKTHGGEAFTAFQALEKASKLYDRLIVSGKLTEDWETGLKRVTIDIRKSKDKREYVVQFEKSKGEPSSVYFFFDQEGEYSGSNFTGK